MNKQVMTTQELNDYNKWMEETYETEPFDLVLILHTESNNLGIAKHRENWRTSQAEREENKKRDEQLLLLVKFLGKKLEDMARK